MEANLGSGTSQRNLPARHQQVVDRLAQARGAFASSFDALSFRSSDNATRRNMCDATEPSDSNGPMVRSAGCEGLRRAHPGTQRNPHGPPTEA